MTTSDTASEAAPGYPPVMPLHQYGNVMITVARENPAWLGLLAGWHQPAELPVLDVDPDLWHRCDPALYGRGGASVWPLPQRRPAAPPAEEVMPHGSGRDAHGRSGPVESVPRPGQEGEGADVPSITGPGHPPTLDDAKRHALERMIASPEYQAALAAADAESWDQPGVSVEDMIEAANARRAEVKRQREAGKPDADAEQFGPPDEPFWGEEKPRIVPPEDTQAMTAVLPAPEGDK